MSASASLAEQYLNGAQIVASGGPRCPFTKDGCWPVVYAPRTKYDPEPWVRFRTGGDTSSAIRHKGTEVRVARLAVPQARQRANEVAAKLRSAGWTVAVEEQSVGALTRLVFLTARREWFEGSLFVAWAYSSDRPQAARLQKGRYQRSSMADASIRTRRDLSSWVYVLTLTNGRGARIG